MAAAGLAGARRPERRRVEFAVVEARRQAVRGARRRARGLVALAAAVVLGALLLVAAVQAEVASRQVRIDELSQQLASAVSENENLQLARSQLASPRRILTLAERQLGMVGPGSVQYLTPVDPGPTVAEAQAAR